MNDKPTCRVFIPQHPSTYNRFTKRSENVGDLSGVMALGHPIFMLPTGKIRYGKLRRTIKALENIMFDFSPRDYLLAVGDPVVIAAAVVIAARKVGGPINIVRWMRLTNEFKVFPAGHGTNENNS
jgi:hypothetical protein